MPKYNVRRKSDGSILTVEASSPAEAMALAPTKGVVVPKAKAIDVSPSQYIREGATRRAGDIGAMIGGTLMPASGLLGFVGRLGAAELGQDVGEVATGQKFTPGYGALTQLVGEGVGTAVSPLLSPKTYKAFADRTVKALTTKLDELVPSWSGLSLYERAHGTGQRQLSHSFEQAIQAIKKSIPDTFIVHVPEVIETAGMRELTTAPRNARELIDEMPDLRKIGGKRYRDALKALSDQLPEGLSDVFDATRAEYKSGAGWIEFAEKGKFLYGKQYDPIKAQEALDKFGRKTLLGRGLDDIRSIVEGPGAKRITKGDMGREGTAVGGLLGAMAGESSGLGHGGGAGGAIGGGYLGHMAGKQIPTYANVPLTPAAKFAGRLGTAAVGEGVREGVRDLAPGLKEKLSVELPGQAAEEARRRAGITP